MRRSALAALVAGALALGAIGWALRAGPGAGTYEAPGIGMLTPELAAQAAYRLVPEMLGAAQAALLAADREALATVATPAAVGVILENPELADPGIGKAPFHEIRLISVAARAAGEQVEARASWQVVGKSDKFSHSHVLGTRYSGMIALVADRGTWKIGALRDITADRSDAGRIVSGE